MSNNFTVIIPARYASTRLPGKPLLRIGNKPMILQVADRVSQSGADKIIIATDHQEIYDTVNDHGYTACLTSEHHNSGTERLAEVIDKFNIAKNEIIVNVQGDEPLIPPSIINQVATNLAINSDAVMATLATTISETTELFNPNVVKVVTDKNNYALYFSRATIPWDREHFKDTPIPESIINNYMRHIGIYAYRASFILNYLKLETSPLEKIESLEQLRVLWHGQKIHVAIAKEIPPIGVDTQEDLEYVRSLIS